MNIVKFSWKILLNIIKYLINLQNFNFSNKVINLKYMNIIDPLFHTNNFGKSVNYHSYSKIKKVFEYMTNEIENLNKMKHSGNCEPNKYLNKLLKFLIKLLLEIILIYFIYHFLFQKLLFY